MLLELPAQLKDGSIRLEHLGLENLAVVRGQDQLATLLKLLPQAFELLGALDVPGSRFPGLPDFTAAEADVRIGLITLLVLLELERRMERLVVQRLPP